MQKVCGIEERVVQVEKGLLSTKLAIYDANLANDRLSIGGPFFAAI